MPNGIEVETIIIGHDFIIECYKFSMYRGAIRISYIYIFRSSSSPHPKVLASRKFTVFIEIFDI